MTELDRLLQLNEELLGNVVFLLDFLKSRHLLLKLCLRRVQVGDDRGQGTRCKREPNDADDFEDSTEKSLSYIVSEDVTVADSGDSGDGVVEGDDVQLHVRQVVPSAHVNPRLHRGVIKLGNQNPETGCNVAHDEGDEDEEDESVEAHVDSQNALEVLCDLVPLLDQFQHARHSSQLDQLVETAETGDLEQLVEVFNVQQVRRNY